MNQTPKMTLPVKPLINPLTDEDRAAIQEVLNRLPAIEDLLLRAQAVGIDVAERMAKHQMHQEIATRLMTHFFPQHLPPVQE